MADRNTNRKGDLGEILAVSWLWLRGYEVFRNAGCTGPIDLVAVDPMGDIHLIDVKTIYGKIDITGSSPVLTDKQKELGVKLLFVDPRSGDCRWTYRR